MSLFDAISCIYTKEIKVENRNFWLTATTLWGTGVAALAISGMP